MLTASILSVQRVVPTMFLALLLAVPDSSRALEGARWEVASASGQGWRARNLQLALHLDTERLQLEGRIERLEMAFLATPLNNLAFRCTALRLTRAGLDCPQFELQQPLEQGGTTPARGMLSYDWDKGDWHLDLQQVVLAGGWLSVRGEGRPTGWTVRIAGTGLRLDAASQLSTSLTGFGFTGPVTGSVSGELTLEGRGTTLDRLQFGGQLAELSMSNQAGTLATEGLGMQLAFEAAPAEPGWKASLRASSPAGQLYLEPVFLDLQGEQVELELAGHWNPQAATLTLGSLRLDHHGVLQLEGSALLALAPKTVLRDADLAFRASGSAYGVYLRPYLFGTPVETLSMAGQISGHATLRDGSASAAVLDLSEVDISDSRSRLAAAGLSGHVDWVAAGQAGGRGHLAWDSAELLKLPIGPATVEFSLSGTSLVLTRPVALPLLGGALQVDVLSLSQLGTESEAAEFSARLLPIDLGRLTVALGWPGFSGTLSGSLPRLSYRQGEVVIGGQLLAQAFGGTFTIDNFRIARPFTDLPECWADLTMRGLDLEQLTRTFAFGRITGHVDGKIAGLHLLRWSPVAFDASLASTDQEQSSRRISQRAIDSISRVSGGPGAALSAGFMGVFQDFGYERLGLGCLLADGVCRMSGVGPAPGGDGYYIVKGRGLPRIDVVGFRQQVDWPRLVEQLRSISTSSGPVVQ